MRIDLKAAAADWRNRASLTPTRRSQWAKAHVPALLATVEAADRMAEDCIEECGEPISRYYSCLLCGQLGRKRETLEHLKSCPVAAYRAARGEEGE